VAGGDVRCSTPVAAVRRVAGTWQVDVRGGATVTARRAVVSAMAPKPFLLGVLRADLRARQHRRIEAVREVVDNVSQLTLAAAIDDAARVPTLGRPELDAGTMWLLTRSE
jgi:hypothetical protein